MSVREQLGLAEDSVLLAQARRRWPQWADHDPRLGSVEDLDSLRPWLRQAAPDEADPVLRGLARLAATDGGDDLAAAAALAHALMPGACRLAERLGAARATWRAARWCTVVPGAEDPDTLVAAQLWLEVRSFPWRRLSHVAANILMNTRAAVLAEYGAGRQVARRDRTWAHTLVLDVFARGDLDHDWARLAAVSASTAKLDQACGQALAAHGSGQPGQPGEPGSVGGLPGEEELASVLAWATESGVITDLDRRLLLGLVEAAWEAEHEGAAAIRVGRGLGGFASRRLTSRVADRVGLAEITVRRRSTRAVQAMAAASAGYAA